MHPFVADLEELTEDNDQFRRVLHTGTHLQLLVMTLQPGQETGTQTHAAQDRFFRIEEGWGKAVIAGRDCPILAGWGFVVPAGVRHNLINSGSRSLKLNMLCSPPTAGAVLQVPEGAASRTLPPELEQGVA